MTYLLPIIVILVTFIIIRLIRKKQNADDTVFVCDICGERDCICYKEKK